MLFLISKCRCLTDDLAQNADNENGNVAEYNKSSYSFPFSPTHSLSLSFSLSLFRFR